MGKQDRLSEDTYDSGITCTMCGKTLDDWDRQQGFGFDYHIGYGSRHDLERVHARFCCDCFDALLDELIQRCKHNPVIGEYRMWEEKEINDDTIDALVDSAGQYI